MMEFHRSQIVKEAEALRAAYLRELIGNFFRALHLRRAPRAESRS